MGWGRYQLPISITIFPRRPSPVLPSNSGMAVGEAESWDLLCKGILTISESGLFPLCEHSDSGHE